MLDVAERRRRRRAFLAGAYVPDSPGDPFDPDRLRGGHGRDRRTSAASPWCSRRTASTPSTPPPGSPRTNSSPRRSTASWRSSSASSSCPTAASTRSRPTAACSTSRPARAPSTRRCPGGRSGTGSPSATPTAPTSRSSRATTWPSTWSAGAATTCSVWPPSPPTCSPDGTPAGRRGDPEFYELNDRLQYLGAFAFRDPVPAYRHDAAIFLRLRGWIAARCGARRLSPAPGRRPGRAARDRRPPRRALVSDIVQVKRLADAGRAVRPPRRPRRRAAPGRRRSMPMARWRRRSPSPTARPVTLVVGNRFTVLPMEGWDGTTDGGPTDLVRRRWQRFGESGAKLIWGGEAVAIAPDGPGQPPPARHRPGHRRRPRRAADRRSSTPTARPTAAPTTWWSACSSPTRAAGRRPTGQPAPRTVQRHPVLDERVGADAASVLDDDELDGLVAALRRRRPARRRRRLRLRRRQALPRLPAPRAARRPRPPRPLRRLLDHRLGLLTRVVEGIRSARPGLAVGVRLSAFDVAPLRAADRTGSGDPCSTRERGAPFGADADAADRRPHRGARGARPVRRAGHRSRLRHRRQPLLPTRTSSAPRTSRPRTGTRPRATRWSRSPACSP